MTPGILAGQVGLLGWWQPGGWEAGLLSATALLSGFLFWRSQARKREAEAVQAAREARQAIRSGRQQVRQLRHLAIRIQIGRAHV